MRLVLTCLGLALLGQGSQIVLQHQPEAGKPQDGPHRPLVWGDLNVISTTDTHGWLRGHLGHDEVEANSSGDMGDLLSFVRRMKAHARHRGVDLLLVDSGDTLDGNGLTDAAPGIRGAAARELFLELPYGLLTVGNHELYNYTVARDIHENFVPRWKGKYLASNVDIRIGEEWKPFATRFRRWKTAQGLRIFSLGVIFDFKLPDHGLRVQSPRNLAKEEWLHEELAKGEIDAIVLVGHIPVRDPEGTALVRALRQHRPKTPALLFGGHAHIRDCKRPDAHSMSMASGRYMETIGWASVNLSDSSFSRRYLDQNRKTYEYHLQAKDFDTLRGVWLSERLTDMAAAYNLSRVYGYSPQSYYLSRFPYNHPASLAHFLTRDVFPKMIVNASRPAPPLMVVNTGSTRFDISEGAFTVDSQLLVLPFRNRNVFIRDVPRALASVLVQNLHGEPGDEDHRYSAWTHRQAAIDSYESSQAANQEELKKLSFGYRTIDECGPDGDDTLHRPLPAYPLPEYVGTELPEGDSIDVAFYDFVSRVILRTLNRLQDERVYTEADVEPYSDMDSNILLGEYAMRYWPQQRV